ncbi:MAG: divalent-cation tolerance protein CutA [Patescibacteria group bacterium]
MVFIYVTCKNHEEAVRIARQLVKKKAAGCVNIFPIQSVYGGGDGELRETDETSMIVKTIDSKVQEAEDIVRSLHSYKTPCIASFALHRLNREYKEWLTSCVV